MTDAPPFDHQPLRERLEGLGFEVVQPPNPFCLTAVALGEGAEFKVAVHFWLGRPSGIEVRPDRIPPDELADYLDALERCRALLAAGESGPESHGENGEEP